MKRDAAPIALAVPPEQSQPTVITVGDDDEVLSPERTASLLNWSLRTLARRSNGVDGPKLVKLSPRRSGYRRAEVRRFQVSCTV